MLEDRDWVEGRACGKVILFGEHAVVYGAQALAVAIPDGVIARAHRIDGSATLNIPSWSLQCVLAAGGDERGEALPQAMLRRICRELSVEPAGFRIDVETHIAAASGLGASAALAIACCRALAALYSLPVDDARANAIAFACEQLAHGKPSGIDNTLACYGGVRGFRRADDDVLTLESLQLQQSLNLLLVHSGKQGKTAEQVAKVASARAREPQRVTGIFQEIDQIGRLAMAELRATGTLVCGPLFRRNQALLHALGVSCAEIDSLVDIAEEAGATGAKLTGSGGGGSVIVDPGANCTDIEQALREAGFRPQRLSLG